MKRLTKSWAALGLSAMGLALCTVSPIASTVITGLAPWVALIGAMTFNVPASRWAFRGTVLAQTAAAYLLSGSVPLALAAFFAFMTQDLPTEPKLKLIGSFGLGLIRYPFAAASIAAFAAAWPVGAIGFALTPAFLFLVLGILMTANGITEVAPNRKGPRNATVKIGEPAPDLILPLRSGDGQFKLSEQRGRHVLLCFLRGDWCPVCQVLMRLYRKAAPMLNEHGVKLVMINPSSGEEARAFARDMGLEYEILVDEDLRAARALGIVSKLKGLDGKQYPLPISLLVDPQGMVRFISGVDDPSLLAPNRLSETLRAAFAAGAS